MKVNKYIIFLMFLFLCIPRVYAFTYELDLNVDTTSVKKNETKEIFVSLKNIKGTDDGVVACSMNLEFDNNISLDSSVRTLNNWSMTHGNFYLFDTGTPILKDTKIFVIPVKIKDAGNVKVKDIECSDGNVNSSIDDKIINFSIKQEVSVDNNSSNNTGNINNQEVVKKDSNCDLSNIILNEGTIEFEPSITEYSIKVNDFENVEVTPLLASDSSSFIVDKNNDLDNKNIVITVTAEDGSSKIYTIYVEEEDNLTNEFESNKKDNNKKKNNYIPIFIGVIGLLLLVNVLRIILKKKK